MWKTLAFSINFVTSFSYNGSEFCEDRVYGSTMLVAGGSADFVASPSSKELPGET